MIAISYRRDDSLPIAGRLYDRLQAKFGKRNVFMDFDSIPAGVDFREQIKQTIERANLVIAVIGPDWLGEKGSSRRIDDPADFVRLEIAYALSRGIPVIPLLVDETPMPKAEKLPPDIEALAFRNALPLDSGIDFHSHTDRLIVGIRKTLRSAPSHSQKNIASLEQPALPVLRAALEPGRRSIIVWSVVFVVCVAAVLAVWRFTVPRQDKSTKPERAPRSEEARTTNGTPDSAPNTAPPTMTPPTAPPPTSTDIRSSTASPTPFVWKNNIKTTVFWIGEQSKGDVKETSAWDADWMRNYGGADNPSPTARHDYIPSSFVPRQNPFYCALPYNDINQGQFKAEAPLVIPWFQQAYSGPGRSVCKDRWLSIRKGDRICYAQWEDCGPIRDDDYHYVFEDDPPKSDSKGEAGLSVSPAVRDFLLLSPVDATDWRFVEVRDVAPGPWRNYGENNHFVIAERQMEQRQKEKSAEGPVAPMQAPPPSPTAARTPQPTAVPTIQPSAAPTASPVIGVSKSQTSVERVFAGKWQGEMTSGGITAFTVASDERSVIYNGNRCAAKQSGNSLSWSYSRKVYVSIPYTGHCSMTLLDKDRASFVEKTTFTDGNLKGKAGPVYRGTLKRQ
jgi:hypothetical protein